MLDAHEERYENFFASRYFKSVSRHFLKHFFLYIDSGKAYWLRSLAGTFPRKMPVRSTFAYDDVGEQWLAINR
jgi:hypothetical protein